MNDPSGRPEPPALAVDDLRVRLGSNEILLRRQLCRPAGPDRGASRPLRQRQDDAAALRGRARDARLPARSPSVRRRSSMPGAASTVPDRAPRPRPRVPVLRAVAAQDGVRQRRLRASGARRRPRRHRGRVAGVLQGVGLGALGAALSASALRRPAAARRARARLRLSPAGHPPRRAAVEPRRQASGEIAHLGARAHQAAGADRRVRDPRPGRGDGDRRRGRADRGGPHRPGRHPPELYDEPATLFVAEYADHDVRPALWRAFDSYVLLSPVPEPVARKALQTSLSDGFSSRPSRPRRRSFASSSISKPVSMRLSAERAIPVHP